MMEKRILIINLGWEQEPLIDACFEIPGAKIYGVHYNNQAYRFSEFERIIQVDLRDLDTILKFAEEVKPDLVVSDQCDYSHLAQAMVADRFNLPGPSIQTAMISSNKWLQREKASKAGLKIPAFQMVSSFIELETFASKQGYPLILKPVDNRGSFGVSKVKSANELKDAYFHAFVNSNSRLVIAEQFIQGFEITVDGYVFNGEPCSLSLARKSHVNSETRVAVDIKYPGEMSEEVYQHAMRNNEVVTKSLGYHFGMIHSEYIVEDQTNDIYLVESANRGGGVYTSEVIAPAVSGVDLVKVLINDVLGLPKSEKPQQISRNEVILKFFTFKPGKIDAILGLDKLRNEPSLLRFRLAVAPGDVIQPISNDANRHGFIIASDPSDVRKKVDELFHLITIQYANS